MDQERANGTDRTNGSFANPHQPISRLEGLLLIAAPALSSSYLALLASHESVAQWSVSGFQWAATKIAQLESVAAPFSKLMLSVLIGVVSSLTWIVIRRRRARSREVPHNQQPQPPSSPKPLRPLLCWVDWMLLYGFQGLGCVLIAGSICFKGFRAVLSPMTILSFSIDRASVLGLFGSLSLLLGWGHFVSEAAAGTITGVTTTRTKDSPPNEQEEHAALWASSSLFIAINSLSLASILQSSMYGYSAILGGLSAVYWMVTDGEARGRVRASVVTRLLDRALPGTSVAGQCWFLAALSCAAWNMLSIRHGTSAATMPTVSLLLRPAAEVIPTAAILHMLLYCGLDWRRLSPNMHELIAILAIGGTATLGSQLGIGNMTNIATFYGAFYVFVKFLSFTSPGALALALEDPY